MLRRIKEPAFTMRKGLVPAAQGVAMGSVSPRQASIDYAWLGRN